MVETAKIFELQPNKGQKLVKKSIIQELPALNRKRRIKIRAQQLLNKEYSLYLDIWHYNKRERKYLKIYLIGRKDTHKKDEENLNLAMKLRDKYELELFQNENDFKIQNKHSKSNFIEFSSLLRIPRKADHKSLTIVPINTCAISLVDLFLSSM